VLNNAYAASQGHGAGRLLQPIFGFLTQPGPFAHVSGGCAERTLPGRPVQCDEMKRRSLHTR
jgi:hypothetical protein